MTTRIYSTLITIPVLTGLAVGTARADLPEPPEPTAQLVQQAERQARWAGNAQTALTMLAAGQTDKALETLKALQRDFPGFDTDGMVALAIGDCHYRLKQYDQARRAYQAAAGHHPALAETLWLRLVEIDLATDAFDAAETALEQVISGTAEPEQKSYAALRLAMVKERQAIRSLQEAHNAYLAAAEAHAGRNPGARRWRETHAADLAETVSQLQMALGQMEHRHDHMPVFWTDNVTASPMPGVRIGPSRLAGELTDPLRNKMLGPQENTPVELSIDKDGKMDITVAGRKIELDEAAQQQVRKHLEQALRMLGQKSRPNDK